MTCQPTGQQQTAQVWDGEGEFYPPPVGKQQVIIFLIRSEEYHRVENTLNDHKTSGRLISVKRNYLSICLVSALRPLKSPHTNSSRCFLSPSNCSHSGLSVSLVHIHLRLSFDDHWMSSTWIMPLWPSKGPVTALIRWWSCSKNKYYFRNFSKHRDTSTLDCVEKWNSYCKIFENIDPSQVFTVKISRHTEWNSLDSTSLPILCLCLYMLMYIHSHLHSVHISMKIRGQHCLVFSTAFYWDRAGHWTWNDRIWWTGLYL